MRFLIIFFLALIALPVAAADLKTVTLQKTQAAHRIILLEFDKPIGDVSGFALGKPGRLVIDMRNATVKPRVRKFDQNKDIAALRLAQFNAEHARLVIDLKRPMAINRVFKKGRVLHIKLIPTSAQKFRRLIAQGRRPMGAREPSPSGVAQLAKKSGSQESGSESGGASAKAADRASVKAIARVPTGKKAKAKSASVQKKSAKANRARTRPLIVIDAGHGGHDVGAISVYKRNYEKTITLKIAREMARKLRKSGRYRVILTREGDKYLTLRQRVRIAQRNKADLFLSVHADSAPNRKAEGATVYTLSEVASDREAARLAAKENKSDVLSSFQLGAEAADVADILFGLAQRETMNASAEFAIILQREMSPYVKFRSVAHRFAGFAVLKAADVPAVLLETGYVSNVKNTKFLLSSKGQKAMADGLLRAVDAYFDGIGAERKRAQK